MEKINVREARRRIGQLLDKVIAGEQIIIMRRGKPVARMSVVDRDELDACKFPNRQDFRNSLPAAGKSAAELLREMRDERG